MHQNSRILFDRYARRHFRSGMRVLEVGPDAVPSSYQQLVATPALTWQTIDLAAAQGSDRLSFVTDEPYCFPLEDNQFDIVLSGQVIEHVPRVWVWIKELARVCKPGGMVITINPINWPYHEAPVDCWRIYPEGMKALYEEAGLDVTLALFDRLDCGESPAPTLYNRAIYEGKQLARRLLNRPSWPLGLFHNQWAVDGITIGVKR